MQIEEKTFAALPAHLKCLFVKLPNPGSDEVLAAFPVTGPSKAANRGENNDIRGGSFNSATEKLIGSASVRGHDDNGGSAARFFYCAKASKADRNSGGAENNHPTVKPADLMRYLCRLVTPAGGLVLDPFMGSGSTLKAAELEGFNAIGIELSPEYIDIARRRIGADAPLFMEPA